MRDLTRGTVGGHVLQLSAFIALSTFFQTLYFVVDEPAPAPAAAAAGAP
jgi:hypothetical protein